MSDDRPLDPDEVRCPKCGADPGDVCRQPNGDRARTIHVLRRRAVDDPPPAARPAKTPHRTRDKPPDSSTFTSETASAAARKSAQERRRRRAEAAAQVEAKREAAEREAIELEAERLARDAVQYDRDRAILRRHTLDAASKAYERLLEGLDGLQVVKLDEDGRPISRPVETVDRNGRQVVRNLPDVRGAYSSDTVERLAKIAASTLVSLRLEEDKPTGITRQTGDTGAADKLGEAGVAELIAWASENLPDRDS